MKKIQILVTILAISFGLKAQDTDKLVVQLSNPKKEAKIQASLVFGSIKVQGIDGNEITIEAQELNLGKDSKSKTNVNINNNKEDNNEENRGMKRLNTNKGGFEITAKEVDNLVKITTNNALHPMSLLIKVPFKTSVKLNTVNNGELEVNNLSGNFELSNVNGNISIKNSSGAVSANTVNGNIFAVLNAVENKPMAFSNLNGKIDVRLPANIKANFKMKSDRGDIMSDFDMEMTASPSSSRIETDKEKGLYKLNKDNWSYGKINGGGSEIMMKTMNGSIYIRKGK